MQRISQDSSDKLHDCLVIKVNCDYRLDAVLYVTRGSLACVIIDVHNSLLLMFNLYFSVPFCHICNSILYFQRLVPVYYHNAYFILFTGKMPQNY